MDVAPDIPGYRVIQRLGNGSMATVFLAVQENLDREVALKIMEPGLVQDPSLCQRFLREGKLIARISNISDIVSVYDIGCHDNHYYMAMEYISGGTLKARIASGAQIQAPLPVLRQLANALLHAHGHGIVHRDVKPGNILFRDDNTAVLTDFGIAKADDAETQFTRVGFTVGSPSYMSPEQRMGMELDGRSDLYSLGVVLYEMLTGEKPFTGPSANAIGVAQFEGPVPKLPHELDDWQGLIDRLLAINPDHRFADAKALIEAIDAFGKPASAIVQTARYHENTHGRGIPAATWIWATPLVLSLSLGGLAWYWLSGHEDEAGDRPAGNLPVDEEPGIEESVAETPEIEDPKIRRLLDVAAAHMAVGRLTEPPGANAFEAYSMVLEIDPGNATALQGLVTIEQHSGDSGLGGSQR